MDEADIILTAPAAELYAYPMRHNARKKKVEFPPTVASAEYEGLLVRTALIRSEQYREGKYLNSLQTPEAVARLLAHLANANQEHFVTIPVNNGLIPLAVHETGIGPTGQVGINQQDVLRVAMLTGATALLVAHNHPSGIPSPSKEDLRVLEELSAAAGCLGYQVLDQMIIAYHGWYSCSAKVRGSWDSL